MSFTHPRWESPQIFPNTKPREFLEYSRGFPWSGLRPRAQEVSHGVGGRGEGRSGLRTRDSGVEQSVRRVGSTAGSDQCQRPIDHAMAPLTQLQTSHGHDSHYSTGRPDETGNFKLFQTFDFVSSSVQTYVQTVRILIHSVRSCCRTEQTL